MQLEELTWDRVGFRTLVVHVSTETSATNQPIDGRPLPCHGNGC